MLRSSWHRLLALHSQGQKSLREGFRPGPQDWLAMNPEEGQTYQQFLDSNPNRPTASRRKLYLQPLGQFDRQAPKLATLQQFAGAFFQLPVVVEPPLNIHGHHFTQRIHRLTRHRQLLTADVMDLLKARLPKDAYCRLAITMVDLYPSADWSYVFGQGSLTSRVGVYSFARFDPAFLGAPRGPGWEQRRLLRSCQILGHETGHLFGLDHCI